MLTARRTNTNRMNNSTTQQINKLTKKTVIYLVLIVALAAGLRTIRAFEQSRYDGDAYVYLNMAKDWSIGGAEYAYKESKFIWMPPLLPYIMSCGAFIGLSPESTGLLLGGFLGSMMTLAIFVIIINIVDVRGGGIVRPLVGESKSRLNEENENLEKSVVRKERWYQSWLSRLLPSCGLVKNFGYQTIVHEHAFSNSSLALLGAFLVTIHPYMIRISVSCMRESLYIPIIVLSIMIAIIAIKRKSIWLWCLFGLLAALAFMTRKEGLELLVMLIIYGTIDIIFYCKLLRKRLLYWCRVIVIVMICFLGIVLPVQYHLSKVGSIWSISSVVGQGLEKF